MTTERVRGPDGSSDTPDAERARLELRRGWMNAWRQPRPLVRLLRLRRRRSRVPGNYLIYHAERGSEVELAQQATRVTSMRQPWQIAGESALALPAEKRGNVER